MKSTNDLFKKEKIIAILSVISVIVLCIQHFWGIFADKSKLQISYIPLLITFTTIAINEAAGSYKKWKGIAITATAGAVCIAVVGVSVVVTANYGMPIGDNEILLRGLYIVITAITLVLGILEIKKLIEI